MTPCLDSVADDEIQFDDTAMRELLWQMECIDGQIPRCVEWHPDASKEPARFVWFFGRRILNPDWFAHWGLPVWSGWVVWPDGLAALPIGI